MLCNFLRCHPSLPFYTLPSTTMSGPSPFATGPRPEEDPLPQCPPRPPAQLWGAERAAAPPPTPVLVPRCPNPRSEAGLVPGEGGASLEDLEPHPAPAFPRGTAETQTTSLRAPLSRSPARGKPSIPRDASCQSFRRGEACWLRPPPASPSRIGKCLCVSRPHEPALSPLPPQTGRGDGSERGRCLDLPAVPLLLGFE